MASEGGTCDEYGFTIDAELVAQFRQHSLMMAERREGVREQWKVLTDEIKAKHADLDQLSRVEQTTNEGERTRATRRLLRGPAMNGVPAEFRPFVWPLLCGAAKARAAKGEHVFPALLQRCEGKDRNQELELDLDRTFPGHPLLDKESAHGAEGIASLHRVLNSYALYNPAVGYCQSMNFIVGILLIMDVGEEDAFWIIAHVSDSLLPNHFAPPMLGAQVDTKLFSILLRRHLPPLAAHLDSIGMDPGMVCGQWFLCIFCNRMPCETVARIWDAVFCKGPQTIFQVALAIFKLCEEQLMACDDMGRAIHILRDFETALFDADALLECTMLHFQSVGDVGKMREELLPVVKKEYADYRRRMDNYRMQENVRKGKDLVKDLGKDIGGRLSFFGQALGSFGADAKAKAESSDLLKEVVKTKPSSWLSSAKTSFFGTASGVPLNTATPEGAESAGGGAVGGEEVLVGRPRQTASGDFWNAGAGGGKEGAEDEYDDAHGDDHGVAEPSLVMHNISAPRGEGAAAGGAAAAGVGGQEAEEEECQEASRKAAAAEATERAAVEAAAAKDASRITAEAEASAAGKADAEKAENAASEKAEADQAAKLAGESAAAATAAAEQAEKADAEKVAAAAAAAAVEQAAADKVAAEEKAASQQAAEALKRAEEEEAAASLKKADQEAAAAATAEAEKAEKAEADKAEADKAAADKAAAEQAASEQADADAAERAADAEKAAGEAAAAQADAEKAAEEQAASEKAAADQLAVEEAAAATEAAEKIAAEKLAAENAAATEAAAEAAAADQLAAENAAAVAKAAAAAATAEEEAAALAKEAEAAEKVAADKLAEDKLAEEKAAAAEEEEEEARVAAALAKEAEAAEKLAEDKLAEEKVAEEKVAEERAAAEKAEAAKVAGEAAAASEKLAAENAADEAKADAEKADAETAAKTAADKAAAMHAETDVGGMEEFLSDDFGVTSPTVPTGETAAAPGALAADLDDFEKMLAELDE